MWVIPLVWVGMFASVGTSFKKALRTHFFATETHLVPIWAPPTASQCVHPTRVPAFPAWPSLRAPSDCSDFRVAGHPASPWAFLILPASLYCASQGQAWALCALNHTNPACGSLGSSCPVSLPGDHRQLSFLRAPPSSSWVSYRCSSLKDLGKQ